MMDQRLEKLFTEALSRQAAGDDGAALLAYKRIQRQFPDFADAWANASLLLGGMGRLDEALAAARRAAGLAPENATVMYSLASAKMKSGLLEEAVEDYRAVIERDAGHVLAMTDLADALIRTESLEEAHEAASRVVEADPGNPHSHFLLATACQKLDRVEEAVTHYRNVVRMDLGHTLAVLRLAEIYISYGHSKEAMDLCEAALRREASPFEHSMLRACLSNAKLNLWGLAAAEEDLALAVELHPGNANAAWGLAYLLAVLGRYREAWVRVRACHDLGLWEITKQDFGKPHWDGGPLEGKTLLVYGNDHSSAGYGDVIQFSRYFPRMKQRLGCRIVLYTYAAFSRLLADIPGVDCLVADGGALPRFDSVVTLGGLPSILDMDLSDLPPPTRLALGPPPARVTELDRAGFRVGLVWAGSASTSQRLERDIDPALFAVLGDIPGVAWYGLQKRSSDEPPDAPAVPPDPDLPGFADMSGHMGDFMDTAQITACMDLLVTVDTSMAHLAGTLGIPTIVLLMYRGDWRWGLDETTPWYPTVKLLRQSERGGWPPVLENLKGEIVGMMEKRRG
jgi:tetratricopeptide (TPR) repeat protein